VDYRAINDRRKIEEKMKKLDSQQPSKKERVVRLKLTAAVFVVLLQ